MKPPNTAILYFEMVLPVFMDRMATDRVKYRVVTLVSVQLDPRRYANGLSRFYLMREAKNKRQEKDILSHGWGYLIHVEVEGKAIAFSENSWLLLLREVHKPPGLVGV